MFGHFIVKQGILMSLIVTISFIALFNCANHYYYPGISDLTNSQLREYYFKNREMLDPIEGYWSINKDYNTNDDYVDELDCVRLAIVKDTLGDNIEPRFIGIVIRGSGWEPKVVGAEFSAIGYSNSYLCTHFDRDGNHEQCIIEIGKNRMLHGRLTKYEISYVRIFPAFQDSLYLLTPDSSAMPNMKPIMPMVAILPLKCNNFTQQESNIISDLLINDLRKLNKFDLYNRSNLEEIYKEHELQLKGCTSNECLAKVGEILGVPYIITGNAIKTGQLITVMAKLLNVQTAGLISSSKQDYSSFDEIINNGLGEVAQELVGAVLINKQMKNRPEISGSDFILNISKCNVIKSRDFFNKNDIFAEIFIDGRIVGRTEVINENNSPVFNYSLKINNYNDGPIMFRLYDQDLYSQELIGSAVLVKLEGGSHPIIGYGSEKQIGDIEVSFK